MIKINRLHRLSKNYFICLIVLVILAACSKAETIAPAATTGITPSTTTPTTPTANSSYNDLWIPPTLTGTTFNLILDKATKQFLPGMITNTYGYNGANFWGPTLIMNKGDQVQINFKNNLSETTTSHWHGFHIPAEMDRAHIKQSSGGLSGVLHLRS